MIIHRRLLVDWILPIGLLHDVAIQPFYKILIAFEAKTDLALFVNRCHPTTQKVISSYLYPFFAQAGQASLLGIPALIVTNRYILRYWNGYRHFFVGWDS